MSGVIKIHELQIPKQVYETPARTIFESVEVENKNSKINRFMILLKLITTENITFAAHSAIFTY